MRFKNPNIPNDPSLIEEELCINGASLIFYTVKALDKPLNDKQIEKLSKSKSFKEIQPNQGYIEKIFSLNDTTKRDHVLFTSDSKTILSPLELESNIYINPVVNHFITLYSKSILLIQSIIVFDKRQITKFPNITEIKTPIKTNHILNIIHKIKNKDDDWHKELNIDVEKTIKSFLEQSVKYTPNLFVNISNKNQQSLSLQIWDIESELFNKEKDIVGEELAKCYELELSAILSCYNEHFSTNELWKQQSANQVHRSALSKTDVLLDHQVLLSERVCVEISQVDYPVLRSISAARLFTYGYDSTSIFLWGYIVLICAGYEKCDIRSNNIHTDIIQRTEKHDWENEDIIRITIDKQRISKEINKYSSLKDVCIEERHKDFIENGVKIKGLKQIQDRIKQVFDEMNELSNLFVATDTSSTSNEINDLLKEVKELNNRNGNSSTSLALISVFVATLTLISLKDDLSSIIPLQNFGVIWVCSVLGAAFILALYIFIKKFRNN